jgi:hypothetical protein
MEDANSTEIDTECRYPVINLLPEQKEIEGLGGTMRLGGHDIVVRPGTLAARMFGPRTRLRFRHRYEVDPRYIAQLEAAGMIFSGKSPRAEIMNILELRSDLHPYFVGTQAHPELTSRPLSPQPFFLGLVDAALRRAYPDYEVPLRYPAELEATADSEPTPAPAREPRVEQVCRVADRGAWASPPRQRHGHQDSKRPRRVRAARRRRGSREQGIKGARDEGNERVIRPGAPVAP